MQEKKDSNKLQLIPKIEKYMEYMMHVIIKLPRVEKFSIGTEYKKSMYNMMSGVVKIAKIDDDIVKNTTNSVKLSELMEEKDEVESQLMEKMDRWEYLEDLAKKIEEQK